MRNPAYIPATLRSVGRAPHLLTHVGLALTVGDGSPEQAARFDLSLEEAERTALVLLEAVAQQRYRAFLQLSKSSGMPSPDVSPDAGQRQ
jgi:hypothetical protein